MASGLRWSTTPVGHNVICTNFYEKSASCCSWPYVCRHNSSAHRATYKHQALAHARADILQSPSCHQAIEFDFRSENQLSFVPNFEHTTSTVLNPASARPEVISASATCFHLFGRLSGALTVFQLCQCIAGTGIKCELLRLKVPLRDPTKSSVMTIDESSMLRCER